MLNRPPVCFCCGGVYCTPPNMDVCVYCPKRFELLLLPNSVGLLILLLLNKPVFELLNRLLFENKFVCCCTLNRFYWGWIPVLLNNKDGGAGLLILAKSPYVSGFLSLFYSLFFGLASLKYDYYYQKTKKYGTFAIKFIHPFPHLNHPSLFHLYRNYLFMVRI